MSNVQTIAGAPLIPQGEPCPALIELCEDLLRDAKSGKLRAIATAEVRVGAIAHGFSYQAYEDKHLATAVMLLYHKFCSRLFD